MLLGSLDLDGDTVGVRVERRSHFNTSAMTFNLYAYCGEVSAFVSSKNWRYEIRNAELGG